MPEVLKKQRRILFVDDEQPFLDAVGELFAAWSQGNWQVRLANTAAQALSVLQEHPVDLVVVDIQMPVMDGLQFIELLNRKYPTLRKVVLTGHAADHYRESSLQKGVELFLEKPQSREDFETVFATLNELAALQRQEGFVGVVRQAGLQDILQMECLARNSSLLEISTSQVRGRIYIEQGSIVHAELGGVTGVSAFNGLLCLRGGEFNLKAFAAPPQRTINGQWEFLVMEAARMRDEMTELAAPPAETAQAPLPAGADSLASAGWPSAREEVPAADTRIDEFLVCSGQGEVLYDWQCKDIESRMKLLNFASQKAGLLGQLLPLGRFDRLEAREPQGRVVIVIAPDRKLLMRCHPVAQDTLATGGDT